MIVERRFGSFRDWSGFVYRRDGRILRQINEPFAADYEHLMRSGLYEDLVRDGLLIAHTEVSLALAATEGAYKVIEPELVPFVSYPYEWCFGQLRDAAQATCEIQRRTLGYGMSLKDASAYNIQFLDGRPVLIDTLSFERYREGCPWVAYRQFCQHFLAPLALMRYTDVRLGQLLRVYVDGIPLDLAAKLLPRRSVLNPGLLLHLHLQAVTQRHPGSAVLDRKIAMGRRLGQEALRRLIESLASTVRKLDGLREKSEWTEYSTTRPSYSEMALARKREIVGEFIEEIAPKTVWDLGANTGEFSRVVRAHAPDALTVAWDGDPGCVEIAYRQAVKDGDTRLLPLVLDLTNPSPGLGWDHAERMSLRDRGPVHAVLALALMHHLVIGNNVPLDRLAGFLSNMCRWLIIEFVPESDSQVRHMLSRRDGSFSPYTRAEFEKEFSRFFTLRRTEPIADSARVLFLMKSKQECEF